MNLQTIKDEYDTCKRCPELVECRTKVVFGDGKEDATVMIIGEAPGKQEDEQGKPFVGKSGQLLNEFLADIDLQREDVFITNTILCRPPDNRNPARSELSNCKTRLDNTIKAINPKVIVTLGNFATQYVLQTKVGITKLRGKVHLKDGRKIIPMQHPAVLLYHGNSPAKRKEFEDDFSQVREVLEDKEQKTLT